MRRVSVESREKFTTRKNSLVALYVTNLPPRGIFADFCSSTHLQPFPVAAHGSPMIFGVLFKNASSSVKQGFSAFISKIVSVSKETETFFLPQEPRPQITFFPKIIFVSKAEILFYPRKGGLLYLKFSIKYQIYLSTTFD